MSGRSNLELTDDGTSKIEAIAPTISSPARIVAGLATLKIIGAAGILIALPFSPAVGGSPLHAGFMILQLVAFGGAGSALLLAHARDRRTASLGTALLCVASAFSTAHFLVLTERVPALSILSTAFPDAFLPYFLGSFVREFPHPRSGFAGRALRVLVPISGLAGVLLFVANILRQPLHGRAMAGLIDLLQRQPRAVLYWQVVFGLVLLILPVAFLENPEWSRSDRRRVRAFWAAFAVCLGPAALTLPLQALPGIGPHFSIWMMSGWRPLMFEGLLALLPVAIAYAVLVERMLPVRVVARLAVQYLLARWSVTSMALVPMAALAVKLYRHRDETVSHAFSGSTVFLMLAMSCAGVGVFWRESILRALDRWFFREAYDARETLFELTSGIRQATNVDELVAHLTAGITRALRPETVVVLLLSESRSHFVSLFGSAGPLEASSTLVQLVAASALALDIRVDARQSPLRWLPRPERHWLVDSGSRLLVALRTTDGELVGLLALGERRSELPYSAADRQWLSALAESAALTIEAHTYRSASELGASDETRWRVGIARQHTDARECPACGEVSEPDQSTCATCGAAVVSTEIPLVLLGKFRFQRRVGRGGMGVVYRAVDLALDRVVAVKTLPGTSPEYAQRLRMEARAMAAVTHAHLAMIYGAESWRGRPMLICEFMEHGTLADRLTCGPLPLNEVLALGIDLAEALEVIHAKGLLHRDIKPSNIGYSDADVPKLLDFGLVHMLSQNLPSEPDAIGAPAMDLDISALSLTHSLVGTPLYLSPEAAAGQPPSRMFDLWSLNVLLFEAITGAHPFRGQSVAETLRAIRYSGLPRLTDARSGQRASVESYFDRALAKEAARRPRSASEVAAALRALLV